MKELYHQRSTNHVRFEKESFRKLTKSDQLRHELQRCGYICGKKDSFVPDNGIM